MSTSEGDASEAFSSIERRIDWELIADYVTGRAAPEARSAVEARCAADPAFRADVEAARLIWERAPAAFDAAVTPADTERAWRRLARELGDAPVGGPHPATAPRPTGPRPTESRPTGPRTTVPLWPRRRRRPRWHAPALAASIVAVAALGGTYGADLYRSWSSAVASASIREVVAEPGQRVAITLSDGGRVFLAPGSTLRAPERFAGDERRVSLSGRAYFEVAHDAERPFIVESEGVSVRVLGTEFDLRAYPGAGSAEIVVRSGRVAVTPTAADTSSAILAGGDRGIVDATGAIRLESGVDVDALLAWTTGRLAFERAPFDDVIAELERWYDVDIIADPSLVTRRLTAAFDREPLDAILETVAMLVNARVRRDGRRIVFTTLPSPR